MKRAAFLLGTLFVAFLFLDGSGFAFRGGGFGGGFRGGGGFGGGFHGGGFGGGFHEGGYSRPAYRAPSMGEYSGYSGHTRSYSRSSSGSRSSTVRSGSARTSRSTAVSHGEARVNRAAAYTHGAAGKTRSGFLPGETRHTASGFVSGQTFHGGARPSHDQLQHFLNLPTAGAAGVRAGHVAAGAVAIGAGGVVAGKVVAGGAAAGAVGFGRGPAHRPFVADAGFGAKVQEGWRGRTDHWFGANWWKEHPYPGPGPGPHPPGPPGPHPPGPPGPGPHPPYPPGPGPHPPYPPGPYPPHPPYPPYPPPGPSWWWRPAAWGALAAWLPYGFSNPVDYDYGNNVYYQDNTVYQEGQPVATADQYYDQAVQIATAPPQPPPQQETTTTTTPSATAGQTQDQGDNWMPLGVFAAAQEGTTTSNWAIQLAVSKQGIIAGTATNAADGTVRPLTGSVDKESQRAAWTFADGKDTTIVMETGIYNLTQDQAGVLVHFGKEKTERWTLVRLPDPKQGSGEDKK